MIRNDDLGYPIVVSDSIRGALRSFAREREMRRFVVLCDRNVAQYATTLTYGMKGRLAVLPFDLGERRKRFETVEHVMDALVEHGADRGTTIVGVGGGVACDLFGFSAATFMRGVPYVSIATSLVAMVDAAIGGKTGVDTPRGKNLAGVFADPQAVFCDVGALRTLPYRNVREGLAEILKAAIIEGGDLFEALEVLGPHPFHKWPWETIVSDSIAVKTMIVNDDRQEQGARETLNLGHTFGHAMERASGFRISHGVGVAVGLRAAGLLAMRTNGYSATDHLRVLAVLALLNLPMTTAQRPENVLSAMSADKKRRAGRLRFVLPRAIGDVEYGVEVSNAAIRAVLQRCASPPGVREFH
ncbi:MAG: 3-dehydroquinate synthase [Candidatus Eremiobacteraeota bacterium]|nr:3-dehydroquinate synthase [Candidatus Eremiobacteraeota bacterium]